MSSMHNFDQQYAAIHVINPGDPMAPTYARATPPESSGRPILLAPGLGADHRTHEPAARYIFNAGREVIVVNHPRHGKLPAKDGVPGEIVQRATNLRRVLDELGLDRVDSIAHSAGGPDTIELARAQPEYLGNLALCCSASLDPTSIPALAWRAGRKALSRQEFITTQNRQAYEVGSRVVAEHRRANSSKLLREGVALTRYNVPDMLPSVRAAGVRAGLLQSGRDKQFLPVSDEVAAGFDAYVYLATAGHDDIYLNPARTVGAVLSMLDGFSAAA